MKQSLLFIYSELFLLSEHVVARVLHIFQSSQVEGSDNTLITLGTIFVYVVPKWYIKTLTI